MKLNVSLKRKKKAGREWGALNSEKRKRLYKKKCERFESVVAAYVKAEILNERNSELIDQ